MSKIIFVTGTGTGVGKTIATATLTKIYKDAGRKVAVIKPIQTGGDDDMATVRELTGISSADTFTLLRYKPALAPEQAAYKSELPAPDYQKLVRQIKDIAYHYDVAFVEGAGGLYVPIDKKHYMIDLCQDLRATAVLVAKTGLGTINHTLLSCQALQRKRIKIMGILFSHSEPEESSLRARANPEVLMTKTKVPVLGILPYQKEISIARLCKAIWFGKRALSQDAVFEEL